MNISLSRSKGMVILCLSTMLCCLRNSIVALISEGVVRRSTVKISQYPVGESPNSM
jgi:hypothetical protein